MHSFKLPNLTLTPLSFGKYVKAFPEFTITHSNFSVIGETTMQVSQKTLALKLSIFSTISLFLFATYLDVKSQSSLLTVFFSFSNSFKTCKSSSFDKCGQPIAIRSGSHSFLISNQSISIFSFGISKFFHSGV